MKLFSIYFRAGSFLGDIVKYRENKEISFIQHSTTILYVLKQLKITWDFLQPIPAFWKFSLHAFIDKS